MHRIFNYYSMQNIKKGGELQVVGGGGWIVGHALKSEAVERTVKGDLCDLSFTHLHVQRVRL